MCHLQCSNLRYTCCRCRTAWRNIVVYHHFEKPKRLRYQQHPADSRLLFFYFTHIGNGNAYIRKMRSAFRPNKDASYITRVENRERMKELMLTKPFGYGLGLAKGERFSPKEVMPYPPDSWLVAVWVETGIVGLVLYLLIHGVLFAWCSWLLMFRIMNQRLRGLLAAWLCMNAGFFVAAYANDVMQYPNSIIVYTGFALCIAGPYIDPVMQKEDEELERERKEKKKRD